MPCDRKTAHCQAMDSANQKLYDGFLQYSVIASALVALCIGYFTWSLKRMLLVYCVGVFLAMLLAVPDWPFFTERRFTEWSEPMASDEHSRTLQKARFPILKKTAKYARREDINPLGIVAFFTCFLCCIYYSWRFILS